MKRKLPPNFPGAARIVPDYDNRLEGAARIVPFHSRYFRITSGEVPSGAGGGDMIEGVRNDYDNRFRKDRSKCRREIRTSQTSLA